MYELSVDSYEKCLARREELVKELEEVDIILNAEDGIDTLIIDELNDGVKRFGAPRRSNVVPYQISIDTEIAGFCVLQLSSDGSITRKPSTNVGDEVVPTDLNGFAVKVDNDSQFIAVDELGFYSALKVTELPIDTEVPLNRYLKRSLRKVIALLPYDKSSDRCVTLISKKGHLKKIQISEMRDSKRPCIELPDDDKLIKGIITSHINSSRDILVFTKDGFGQRFDPNDLRVTSYTAKGGSGFKLSGDDEILGCYSINASNRYLLYVTMKGKMRLNKAKYLPVRSSKHDSMVKLISLPERDKLVNVVGCSRTDSIQVFFDDETNESIKVADVREGTMSSAPEKMTKKNAVSSNIIKVRIV
jgi:DNA gyrase/topoisomerase IV subunit A